MAQLYDSIGRNYRLYRKPDPRIAKAIRDALADSTSVLNAGAGAGSYEPTDIPVVAVEPSETMIRQRATGAAPAIRASGSCLPFRDDSFDAALAILTIHHWPEPIEGVRELARVARRRVVLLTWDVDGPGFWLTDYFPMITETDRAMFPTIRQVTEALGSAEVIPVPVPHDCSDGFLGAYWRRPEAYLDPAARSAISAFSLIGDLAPGLSRLQHDLESGRWHRRYGTLSTQEHLDIGYRLIVSQHSANDA